MRKEEKIILKEVREVGKEKNSEKKGKVEWRM